MDSQEDSSQSSDSNQPCLVKAYITGLGWCWMHDGEVIEVISHLEDN